MKPKITIAYGDGIGPEIMKSTLAILEAAGASFDTDEIEIGEKVYLEGHSSGIRDSDWEKIVANKVLLKGPIKTPQGKGFKSLNVTIRKTLGLFANVRPVRSLDPFVTTKHPELDTVIIRENEEDVYAGIEHRQTEEVYQCLKLMSKPGCEKIIRYAFEYAKQMGRKKVTCMSKDNIMKLTDGLFHKCFEEIKKEYPEIETDHYIIDIGMARFANQPELFDVIVLPNLYGDILSDVAAEVSGSVGLAGSSNIGQECAMFEAIHGTAPLIAGQNVANPSGLLMGAVLMLNYLGQGDVAKKIKNAWLKTIEDGMHTGDIYSEDHSRKKLSTEEFTAEVISRLGQAPEKLSQTHFPDKAEKIVINTIADTPTQKDLDGVDIFICENDRNPNTLGDKLKKIAESSKMDLVMITNRGVKVYPDGNPLTFCTDHWRCRFDGSDVSPMDVIKLQEMVAKENLEIIKTENLYRFAGQRGYSLGQGQ